ncbi:MAG: PAS domain S-box protein [Actinomycetota bacterium]|nr:PAS domain S-box protein [Actinomycetota bacterium]
MNASGVQADSVDRTDPFFGLGRDLMAVVDFDGRFVRVNPAWTASLGWTEQQLLGQRSFDLVHPDDVARTQAEAKRSTVSGSHSFINRYRARDGSWRWLEWVSQPVPDQRLHYSTARDITDRRRSELALAASEARQQLLIENLPETIVMVFDASLSCTYIGGGGSRVLGQSATAARGRPLFELVESLTRDSAAVEQLARAGMRGTTTTDRLAPSATGRTYEIRFVLLPDGDGLPLGVMAVASDVTDRLAQQQRAEQLASVVESSGDAIIAADFEERVISANAAACDMFGYEEHELIGLDAARLTSQDSSTAASARKVALSGKPWHGTLEGVRRGGRQFPLRGTFSPLRDASEDVVGISLLLRDISRERLIERRMRQAVQEFQQAFDHAPIGMAVVSLDGRLMRVNAALSELTGYSAAELRRRHFRDLAYPEDADADRRQLAAVLGGLSSSYRVEKRYVRRDGSVIWVLLSVSLVRNEDNRRLHFIAQVHDISEQKKLESELRAEAHLDPLTGAINRRQLEERLGAALEHARRYGEQSALVFLDLDDFKEVNDRHGHHAGDELLRAVALSLKARLRSTDYVARVGGDEFAVLLSHVNENQAKVITRDLERAISSTTVMADGERIVAGGSCGTALLDGISITSPTTALQAADAAMYKQKQRRARLGEVSQRRFTHREDPAGD